MQRDKVLYRPYLGTENGKAVRGPHVELAPASAPLSHIWKAYERVIGTATDTLKWLLDKYTQSAQFKALGPRTQADYLSYMEIIVNTVAKDGTRLGDFPFSSIRRTTIRGYLDNYGAPIAANRHIQFMKAAYYWAMERYEQVQENPCAKVKLNVQTSRTRYITDEEYATALTFARGYIPVMMELAYLLRARRSEVTKLRASDLLLEGIRLERGKGSEGEITLWSPRLRAAVAAAQAIHQNAPIPIRGGAYLLHDKEGRPIQKNAFDTAWQRFMGRVKANTSVEHFTYHDLKAKGISDHKTNFGGHRDQSGKMRKTYVRKLQEVEPTA